MHAYTLISARNNYYLADCKDSTKRQLQDYVIYFAISHNSVKHWTIISIFVNINWKIFLLRVS